MFEGLQWKRDRVLLGDLVFRLELSKDDRWELGDDCFLFIKTKELVDQYERFWATRPGFRARNVFELGIWDGGSVALWHETLRPEKHVAIDLGKERMYPKVQSQDGPYFTRYVASRGLQDRVKTYWGVDQGDAAALRDIAAREFREPLDLVLDDASHLYGPTKASFETLFPMVRPGGLYVIEDWAWEHWKEFHAPGHPWAREESPTRLIHELVEVAGGAPDLVADVTVHQGFVAVERGPVGADRLGDFRLDQHIFRRPPRPEARPPGRLRRWLGRAAP